MSSEKSLILATPEGIGRIPISKKGSLGSFEPTLKEVAMEAVCQDSSGLLYAGADKGQIFRSKDGGFKWEKVFEGFPNSRGLWSLVAHPVKPGTIYSGLEPVSIWESVDQGVHWRELKSMRTHPSSKNWEFFEPAKPHIRAISFDARGERFYVGIEKGGILVSKDGGETFEDKSQGVDRDFHVIQVAPKNPDHLFGMTGDGLFRSKDGGNHWEKLEEGLSRWYFIPLAFVSEDTNLLCVGAGNTSPSAWRTRGADASIYWSKNGGDSWEQAKGPFPLRGMLSAIIPNPENPKDFFASTIDGGLLRTLDGGKNWDIAKDHLPRIEEMVFHGK